MKKQKKWKTKLTSLINYPKIRLITKNLSSDIIFFFPHYNTGGAERVHLDIMKSLSEYNMTCYITEQSQDTDLKKEFEQISTLVELYIWGSRPKYRKKFLPIIAKKINAMNNVILFGCNSRFFYDLIPLLSTSVKCIDLIHTFLGEYDYSMDNYSLEHIPKLDARVVLGESQRKKQIEFYGQKGIPTVYADRIKVIPNKVDYPTEFVKKDYKNDLTILFVSRDSEEKRPLLFIEITKICYELKLPFKFFMIGEFEKYKDSVRDNVELIGKILDKHVLNEFYSKAHFVMLTSLFEGLPLVLLEGLAQGAIPLTTNVGEIPSYINEDFQTGFLINNSIDESKLVNQFIDKLKSIDADRTILPTFSECGQKLVRRHFNKETFQYSYQSLIKKIMD